MRRYITSLGAALLLSSGCAAPERAELSGSYIERQEGTHKIFEKIEILNEKYRVPPGFRDDFKEWRNVHPHIERPNWVNPPTGIEHPNWIDPPQGIEQPNWVPTQPLESKLGELSRKYGISPRYVEDLNAWQKEVKR